MKDKRRSKYYLEDDRRFVIENYDLAKPFASFFPGIAGLFGIPMWVFYVNRGQGIVSFGTQDKNHAICEFFPANRAWQFVTTRGFRTFMKINGFYYEPFQNKPQSIDLNIQRKMFINSENFQLQEINNSLGLDINVDYCMLANEPLGCLIRKLKIKNISRTKKNIEILDGLAQIVPYGANDRFLKELGRTIEAWMQVEFATELNVPFYKLAVDPTDRPQVIYVKGGNFYYSFRVKKKQCKNNSFVVAPEVIFGSVTDFNYPQNFLAKDFSIPKQQITFSKTPAAFSYADVRLKPAEEIDIISLIGYAKSKKVLQQILSKAMNIGYLQKKCDEYKNVIKELQGNIFTASNIPAYDFYCQQTFLDNVLRGGFPLTLIGKKKTHIFHVYSRKHGDLERDYNNFFTEATYFSQGNGNYRDVNQNRRNDVWFNTKVEDSNVLSFFNLIQLDGFNPLIVSGDRFRLPSELEFEKNAHIFKRNADYKKAVKFMKRVFSLGGLFMFLEENSISLTVSKEKFLQIVLFCCQKREHAEHGDGFWVDHWAYNIDALQAYLAIYPEKLRDILLDKKRFVFFNNFVKVKPRDEKFVLYQGRVRQYHALSLEEIEENSEISRKIRNDDWAVRTEFGKGAIYKTTLLVKIICLIANKIASLDPFGAGVEMEANKPGWYDALNGLPALFGSSVCQTMELKRLIDVVCKMLDDLKLKNDYYIKVPRELYEFIDSINELINEYNNSKAIKKDFIYWDTASRLKESYLRRVSEGISGRESRLNIISLKDILKKMSDKLSQSIKKSRDKKNGLFHTYFINEITDYEKIKVGRTDNFKISTDGLCCVRPKRFCQKPFPLFLEGQVHAMRLVADKKHARSIYKNTKKSPLYDKKLKMYKVNASLNKMSKEIGRAAVFTPGWLENESIWLHMEYKFIFELLRCGLYEEFFVEFKNVLIPFQRPERYGRSILENSSFLVSSAYPDKSLHGNGYVARLSGSTAEFINIWLWMNVGQKPFLLDDRNELILKFNPVLPSWIFTKQKAKFEYFGQAGRNMIIELAKNSYAFIYLGKTLVIYHNPKRKNTFGNDRVRPKIIKIFDKRGKKLSTNIDFIRPPFAQWVRNGQIDRIEIELN